MSIKLAIYRFLLKVLPRQDVATCQHEWWVYSTALSEGWLELYCKRCQVAGAVKDPTKEEWAQGFHAPEKEYRWEQSERVHIGERLV